MIPSVIRDAGTVTKALALLAAEVEACASCKANGTHGPRHARAYQDPRNGNLIQSRCESGNRVFDPGKGVFIGNAHCTCDSCF